MLLLTLGCKSDQQKTEATEQTVTSWRATVRMTDSAAARHGVPRHFQEEVRETARDEIAKAMRQ